MKSQSSTVTDSSSYVRGEMVPSLLESTIGDHLTTVARAWRDQPALISVHQRIRLTYGELLEHSERVAAAFIRMGLRPGDRVGIWAPNCVEWILTLYGSALAGLVLVTINPAYRRHEAEYALRKVGCRALVMAAKHKSSDYVAIMREIAPELETARNGLVSSSALPDLKLVFCMDDERAPGMLGFDALLQDPSEEFLGILRQIQETLRPTDPINIQFTSGTTGNPKGATLTHRSILNNGFFNGERMRLTHQDRLCLPVPLYHCFGLVLGVLACATHAATVVLPASGFDAKATIETIDRERCTAVHGVPTMFGAILEHEDFRKADVTSLRTGIMAGAPCPVELMRRVIEQLHMNEITIAYGMTETSPSSFQGTHEDTIVQRVSTVGKVHPHVEVKIIGPSGEIAPLGEEGEICVRGYGVMRGYWGDDAKTAEVIDAENWMHSGDIGRLDETGRCAVTGRLKDIIIRGGENIAPGEIEEFLHRHPDIADVQCVGVRDEKFGEVACACVVLRAGRQANESDIKAFCSGKIAHYKIPQYIRFVDEFPMTVTGKVRKNVLKQMMQDRCTPN
jgi:fatty-acyl-CoA synthase